jgi:hypothetical protein
MSPRIHPTTAFVALAALVACAAPACGGDGATGVDAVPTFDPPDAEPPAPAAKVFVDAVDFGLADCGGAAPDDATVRLRNNGVAPLTWSALVRFSPAFTIIGTNGGTLQPGEQIDLVVRAAPQAADAVAGARTTDVLRITTNDPAQGPIELPLSVTAAGAVFEVLPRAADFGLAPIGVELPPIPLEIRNTGNQAARLSLVSPARDGLSTAFDGPFEAEVAPGATLPGARATFAPGSTQAVRASAALQVVGAVCAGSATEVPLSGQGTRGTVVVSPALLDFGKTDCGAAVIPRTLSILNTGSQAFTYTAALAAGDASRYFLDLPTATIVPGGRVDVQVTARPMPAQSAITANLYGETLTLTTDVPGDAPRTIALESTARGAIVVPVVASRDLGRPRLGAVSAPDPVEFVNVGNASVTLAPSVEQPAPGGFAAAWPADRSLAPGESLRGDATYRPVVAAPLGASITLTAEGPTCAELPAVTLTGDGTLAGAAEAGVFVVPGDQRVGGNVEIIASCFRVRGGLVACAGVDTYGLRGDGPTTQAADTPSLVLTDDGPLDEVVDLVAGHGFVCARRAAGDTWCWGNLTGRGRSRDPAPTVSATKVHEAGVTALTAASKFTCAVVDGGLDCAAGSGPYRLYDPTFADKWAVPGVTTAALHPSGGLAVKEDGTVVTFGTNRVGERGLDTPSDSPPTVVPGLADVVAVAASGTGRNRSAATACARTATGTMLCWGRGRHGNLGQGLDAEGGVSTPRPVLTGPGTPLTGVTRMAVARDHSCAIAGGAVFCWGRGREGQLGYGTADSAYARRTSPIITGAVELFTGFRRSCAVLATGRVACWGETFGGAGTEPTYLPMFEP